MTFNQEMITILLCAFATALTRFLPFILFRDEDKTPGYILFLSHYLPLATFAMLVVYCLKDVSLTSATYGIAEAIALSVTILMHKWKKRMLVSIISGTICYMVLLQIFF